MASAEDFVLNIRVPTAQVDAATAAVDKLHAAGGAAVAALDSVGAAAAVAGIKLRGLNGRFISKDALAALAQAIPGFEKLSDAAKKAALAESAAAKASSDVGDKLKATTKAAEAKAKLDEKMLRQSEKLAAADANAASNETMGGKLNGMIGAMENANGVTGKLTAALRSLGPAGAAAAAAITVLIAVVGAAVIAFRDMVAAAISISQEKDALAATFKALSTGAESGVELVDSLSEVAAALPFAEGKVLAWGKSLMSAGIEGEKLTSAVNAVAAATALMGDEGGQAVQTMVKQLAMGGSAADTMLKTIKEGGKRAAVQLSAMGLQAKDLAAALGMTPEQMKTATITAEQMGAAIEKAVTTKGAGALEAMGLTWDSIKGKLSDGAEDLFEDMGAAVQPFMREVKALFSEFFAGSTTMSTAKDVITAVLTEVFAVAAKVVNFIHQGFLTVEIAAFKIVTALWPVVSVLKAIAANETLMNGLVLTLKAIGVVILVVVGFVGLFAASIGILMGFFGAVTGAVWSAMGAIVGALMWCVGDAARATGLIGEALSGWATAAYDAAGNFVSGIVNGITSGVGAVVAAVKGLASSAMSAFTGFFKIKSPSQVMVQMGGYVAEGAAIGIDKGAGDVAESMGDMGEGGAKGAAKGFGKGGAKASNGEGVTINGGIHYHGSREEFPDFETRLLNTLARARGMVPA